MKRLTVIFAVFFILAACPEFEKAAPIEDISISFGGTIINDKSIEIGETVQFYANIDGSINNVSIIWELNNENAAIISSGEGITCSIKGMIKGSVDLTIKAWRSHQDTPIVTTVPITIEEPRITDINLTWSTTLGVNEERELSIQITPSWAVSIPVTWTTSTPALVNIDDGKITGISAGTAAITAAADCGFTKNFNIEVKTSDTLNDLKIFNGNTDISGANIELELFQELQLAAVIQPANAFTFFTWTSSAPEYVSVNQYGEIKGLQTTQSAAPVTITVTAGGQTSAVTFTVKNPITGIRVRFDNSEELPVINTIWLYPGETVNLKVELAPAGIETSAFTVDWQGANEEVSLSADGLTCALTGGAITIFEMPPTEIRITALNPDNMGKYVSTVLRVKTQPKPIWAWDRGRDYNDFSSYSNLFPVEQLGLTLQGRGDGKFAEPIPFVLGGNPINYTDYGFKINSSNSAGGANTDPIGNPANSTRMAIGVATRLSTNPMSVPGDDPLRAHQRGVFDFDELARDKDGSIIPNTFVRVSVDYEIIWTAGAGRNMWIMLNNNNANAAQSILNTASQILINPLTAPRGTRATAVTSVNISDFLTRPMPGWETLETSFIGIVALSNGGSIYVSGIRIEEYKD